MNVGCNIGSHYFPGLVTQSHRYVETAHTCEFSISHCSRLLNMSNPMKKDQWKIEMNFELITENGKPRSKCTDSVEASTMPGTRNFSVRNFCQHCQPVSDRAFGQLCTRIVRYRTVNWKVSLDWSEGRILHPP